MVDDDEWQTWSTPQQREHPRATAAAQLLGSVRCPKMVGEIYFAAYSLTHFVLSRCANKIFPRLNTSYVCQRNPKSAA